MPALDPDLRRQSLPPVLEGASAPIRPVTPLVSCVGEFACSCNQFQSPAS